MLKMNDCDTEITSIFKSSSSFQNLKCSVIIPTYNRSKLLKKSLNSIISQDFEPYLYEIIVVDNGSTDNTYDTVKSVAGKHTEHKIRFMRESEPGLHSGRHRGAFESEAEILIYVDDDIMATPNWLNAIVEAFEDPSVHVVGGPCLPIYEIDPPEWLVRFWRNDNGRISCGPLSLIQFYGNKREIDPIFIWGLNYSIKKETLFNLGGFHPDSVPKHLLHYRGDGESGLSNKIKEKGFKAIYSPEAMVYHIIPKERLTLTYFEKRFHRQGISDSYTEIRKKKLMYECNLPICPKVNPKKNILFENKNNEHFIEKRINNAYSDGYSFHQEAVRNNKYLLEWVLRDNYFNCKIPKISENKGYSDNNIENFINISKKSNNWKKVHNSQSENNLNFKFNECDSNKKGRFVEDIYNNDFYKKHQNESLISAKVIVPLLLDVFPANSVVDIGCGTGTWLAVFRDLGVKTIKGYDINELSEKNYLIDKKYISTKCNLETETFSIDFKADLAICLEVGEHLAESAADNLIKNLVNVAPAVIFSAAFPGQTGVHHINEQPPWYWREKFQKYEYIEIDFIRPIIWSEEQVSWWYRQNMTAFVNPYCIKNNQLLKKLWTRFKVLKDPKKLTVVSEWILKKNLNYKD